jgi:hypothetical protein
MKKTREPLHEGILDDIRARLEKKMSPRAADAVRGRNAIASSASPAHSTDRVSVQPQGKTGIDHSRLWRALQKKVRSRPQVVGPMTPAPKRRWFRWSLRTMFVVVTVFGCWLGYQLNWIRQRHQLISEQRLLLGELTWMLGEQPDRAPWNMRLFGETGWQTITLVIPKNAPKRYVDDARRLFPEAEFIDVLGEQFLTDAELEELRK